MIEGRDETSDTYQFLRGLEAGVHTQEKDMVKVKVLKQIQAGWFNGQEGEIHAISPGILAQLNVVAPGTVEVVGSEPVKPKAEPDPVKARQIPGAPPDTKDRKFGKDKSVVKGK